MIEIKPSNIGHCYISVPGSKSYTHRALVAAALSNEPCLLTGMLESNDIEITCCALKKLGVSIFKGDKYVVNGLGGYFKPYRKPIYLGDSGTSMRLLTGIISLGRGIYTLFGSERMHKRPMSPLINAMNRLGLEVYSLYNNGCAPIKIKCSKIVAKVIEVDCDISSQYLSSLLFIAPCFKRGLEILTRDRVVSRPYIDMTIAVMEKFGIFIERDSYKSFHIPGGQSYRANNYTVEPDCSHACYFWAAAAITRGSVTVKGLNRKSKQGDIKFLNILERMGCAVDSNQIGITVTGRGLKAISIDMSDMPDAVPTLAVLASFARGVTVIYGVSHLRAKESDRILAITNGLNQMDVFVETDGHKLVIMGGNPKSASIDTYNDHRIAMSFALAGLRVPKLRIRNETCVNKSFSNFWKTFEKLY